MRSGGEVNVTGAMNINQVRTLSATDSGSLAGHRHTRTRTDEWRSRYARNVRRTDALVIFIVVTIAQLIRFGTDILHPMGRYGFPGIYISMTLAIGWIAGLRIAQASDRRIIGAGATEYTRILHASAGILGVIALVDLVLNLSVARGYVAIVIPFGVVALVISRWLWRKHIVSGRAKGQFLMRVLLVGTCESSSTLQHRLLKSPGLGYRAIGMVLPDRTAIDTPQSGADLPVYGDFAHIRQAVEDSGATAVAVTSADVMGHSAIRELSWQIEGMGVEMLVVPGILDVAGPRITMRPNLASPYSWSRSLAIRAQPEW